MTILSAHRKIADPLYALINPDNTVSTAPQNIQTVSNANLPAAIKTGIGTNLIVLETYFHNMNPTAAAYYIWSYGKGGGANQKLALRQVGGNTFAINISGGVAQEFVANLPGVLDAAVALHMTVIIDLGQSPQTVRAYLFGQLQSAGTLSGTHNLNNITEEFTVFDRENSAVSNAQTCGILYRHQLYRETTGMSTDDQDQIALDLNNSGSSSLLTDCLNWIEPDATDVSNAGVRNRAADATPAYAFGGTGYMTREGEAKIQQVRGVKTGVFYAPGLTGGSAQHFSTSASESFDINNAIWLQEVVTREISTTEKTICGDDNNALGIYNNATNNVVRVRTDIGGTPAAAESAAIADGQRLIAGAVVADFADDAPGTRKVYAVANGVMGTGTATGSLPWGGEMAIGAQGSAGNTPYKGPMMGGYFIRFKSDGDVPALDKMREILLIQCEIWPELHPLIYQKLTDNDCEIVRYRGSGLETLINDAGRWAWFSESINTTQGAHHMMQKTGVTDNPLKVGDAYVGHPCLFVGDPTGSNGSAETLGIQSNPYQGSACISAAIADALRPGTEVALTGPYDYKATGNQNITFLISGNGADKNQFTGFDGALVDYATFGALTKCRIYGKGQNIARTGGNCVGGSGADNAVWQTIMRDSTTGRGIEVTGANNLVAYCGLVDNNSDGARVIGVDSVMVNTWMTGNGGNAAAGGGNLISDYNIYDGTRVGITLGANDDTTSVPTFVDATGNNFKPLGNSPQVDAGQLIRTVGHDEVGPFGFFLGGFRNVIANIVGCV